jgi:hypothetical protein
VKNKYRREVEPSRRNEMKNRLHTLCFGAALALGAFMTRPAVADEWNKKTEFQFSGPVEIPGKVLPAGKYVFELADSESNRNIVEVFSEDSKGKESLVTTILAIPDYMEDTPDKPIVQFEERKSGAPEAIHSWFYPGENTGWQFLYPKGETLQTSMNTTPTAAPADTPAAPATEATAADAPSAPPEPQAQDETPRPEEVTVVEEEVSAGQDDTPAPPAEEVDVMGAADRVLPETAGYSGLELMTGLAMLGGGVAAVFASRCKSAA